MVWTQNTIRYSGIIEDSLNNEWDHWNYQDLKTLESWGDAYSEANDIIAIYEKEDDNGFYFRTDFLNLQDSVIPYIYFAIDFKTGGNTLLELNNSILYSDIQWDILVWISDMSSITVYDTLYNDHPEYIINSNVDIQLDLAEFGLSKDALNEADNSSIQMQVFTVNHAKDLAFDQTQPVNTVDTTGRAKLVLPFMNGFIGYGPNAVSWYDGFALRPDERSGERRGFKYILDAAEKYKLPLTINDLRIEQLPSNEYLRINERISDLYEQDLLDPLTTLTYGHFMPWQPDEVDARAIEIAKDLRNNMQLPISDVFYPYEAMLTAGDIQVIQDASFSAIFGLDQYRYWMGWIDDWSDPETVKSDIESLRKIHKINDMKFFFDTRIGNYQGFITDSRWEEIDWSTWSEYNQYIGTDKGLDVWWRRPAGRPAGRR